MRKPFTKFLSVLTVLAFLVVPITSLAENELTPISLDFGSSPKSFVVVPASGLDTTDLYLNDISYDAKLNGKGDICLYAIDIAAAAKATDILNQYIGGHLVQPYSMLKDIIIGGSEGIDLRLRDSLKALPDVDEVGKKLVKTAFPIQVRSNKSLILVNALRGMMAEMSVRAENRPLVERLAAILENFSANERGFSKSIGDIYAWLYEVRSAIAKGDVDSKFLTQKQTKDVLEIFREIMTEGGMVLEDIEFWDDDDAWVGWALKNSEPELSPGMTVKLGDGTGKTLPLTVRTISTPQKESEPQPDESEPEPGPHLETDTAALTIACESLGVDEETVELVKGGQGHILFDISDGPNDAKYTWTVSALPAGLSFAVDSSTTSAKIEGTPTAVTGGDGSDVTVGASTTVSSILYSGSLRFTIIISESSSGLGFSIAAIDVNTIKPPAEEPPAEEPPAEEPMAEEPPAEEPPAEEPPAEEPPAEEPPAEEPPAEEPPAEEPPAEELPEG